MIAYRASSKQTPCVSCGPKVIGHLNKHNKKCKGHNHKCRLCGIVGDLEEVCESLKEARERIFPGSSGKRDQNQDEHKAATQKEPNQKPKMEAAINFGQVVQDSSSDSDSDSSDSDVDG